MASTKELQDAVVDGFLPLAKAIPVIQHVAGGRGKEVAVKCKEESPSGKWTVEVCYVRTFLGIRLPWTAVTLRVHGELHENEGRAIPASFHLLADSRRCGCPQAVCVGATNLFEVISSMCGLVNVLVDVIGYQPVLAKK